MALTEMTFSGPLNTPKGTADISQVLEGYTFSSDTGICLPGAMINNGAVNKTLTEGSSFIIPEGYHNGSGKLL